jgi:hypothetical protein
MLGDKRIEYGATARFQRGQRTCLIGLHHPAKTDHIGGEDGCKAALSAFFGHAMR